MTRRNISLGVVFRLFLGRAPRLSFSDVVCVRRVTHQSINQSIDERAHPFSRNPKRHPLCPRKRPQRFDDLLPKDFYTLDPTSHLRTHYSFTMTRFVLA